MRCDGSCVDPNGEGGICEDCLAEVCRCGHTMGQHAFGDRRVPCDHLADDGCSAFVPATVVAVEP